VPAVSVGSTPTALAAERLDGVTEVRAGVFVLSDLFQSELNETPVEDIAACVLASVIGVHGERVLLDAGALALSKDRSLDGRGGGHGEVRALDGSELVGRPRVHALNQEHGFVRWPGARPSIGDRVRVLPNHACLTAAQHRAYHVVEGERVVEVWPRVVGF
jgi:D-serine deaminase-like pyridoxal phosphate-dependent protein